jgi:hypothetical protein
MQAVKYKTEVHADGRIDLPQLDLKEGTWIEVIVLVPDAEAEFAPLLATSLSSTDFWDNSIDDQVWNDA